MLGLPGCSWQLQPSEDMKLAVTGFVSEQAGSVASANALLIRELLRRGHEIHFFSKPSFVDPRPAVGLSPGFRFFDVTNVGADRLRQRLSRVPLAGFLAGQFDASTYNRLLVQQITANQPGKNMMFVSGWGTMPAGELRGSLLFVLCKGHRAQTLGPSSGRALK